MALATAPPPALPLSGQWLEDRRHYFKIWMAKHWPNILPEDREDLIANAYERALDNQHSLSHNTRGERGVMNWLHRIISNAAIDHWRHQETIIFHSLELLQDTEDAELEAHTAAQYNQLNRALLWQEQLLLQHRAQSTTESEAITTITSQEQHQQIETVWQDLSPDEQHVLLAQQQEQTYRQIAERDGVTMATIKSKLYRSRQHFIQRWYHHSYQHPFPKEERTSRAPEEKKVKSHYSRSILKNNPRSQRKREQQNLKRAQQREEGSRSAASQ